MGNCSSSKGDNFDPVNTRAHNTNDNPPPRSAGNNNTSRRPSSGSTASTSSASRHAQRSTNRQRGSGGAQQQQQKQNAPSSKNKKPPTNNRHPSASSTGNNNGSSRSNSTSKADRNVTFVEFKDREKNMVDSILENNRHLRMASVNFEDLKLQKIIGSGAFGEVIKGTYCGTPVVVKRMLRNKIDENNLRMFGEEIQLMMNLRHPNIVQFIGASWNSYSNVCFVTEYLERGDLFSVLRNPKYVLSYQDPILRMLIDTSRGMAYLHSMKPQIIHRDLKSMNILVGSTFGCKVSDFGLSREKSVDETMSVTGTPLWLPPEMIRGERYTEKADVYSFGIVLSEFDTRKIPYHDIKAKGARHKKVSGSTLMHMVAYEGLRPSLSRNALGSVKSLYERCTADDVSRRPSFEDIVQELDSTIRHDVELAAEEEQIAAEPATAHAASAAELGVTHATKYTDDNNVASFEC